MGKIKNIVIRSIEMLHEAGYSVQEIAQSIGCEEEIVLEVIG